MMFQWSHALWLLLTLPALIGAYVALLRGNKNALRYSRLDLAREAAGWGARLKPHVPAAILLAGIAALLIAVARPIAKVMSPSDQGTVILLMDVSLSMAASDVPPTRLDAARAAAAAF